MNQALKVLSIGSDTKLFAEGSAVRIRAAEYGKLFKELHIAVFTLKKDRFEKIKIAENVWAYPTNSPSKIFYINDGIDLSRRIALEASMRADDSVITVQDPFESGVVGALLKQRLGLGLHVQIHTDFLDSHFRREHMLNPIRRLMAPFVLRRADAIRAVSPRIKSSIVSKLLISAEKISVLPIFVDAGKIAEARAEHSFREKYPDLDCVGLMLSRITREKRIGIALEALAIAISDNPRIGLVIAGDGPEKKNLKALAEKLCLGKNAIFLGWQSDPVPLYKAADFFLLTSSYEGYGMTLVEAAAAGLPIISTDVGIAPELIEDGINSLIVGDPTPERAAVQILKLGGDMDLRKEWGALIQRRSREMAGTKEEYLLQYRQSTEAALAGTSRKAHTDGV